jgi:tRNA-splicing ligase RtcB (3'-phosphate/5'-hydroxy nucleic acid ligase)
MKDKEFDVMDVPGGSPVKMWTRGVPVEEEARRQLANTAAMPFIYKHIAVMPDVHLGKGSTIGSVIPTLGAVIPAAVGVDIGCGMMAAKTTLNARDLPDNLGPLRSAIEKAIPHGLTPKFRGRDRGSWENPPSAVDAAWAQLKDEFDVICEKTPKLEKTNNYRHLGTLGSGNHFVEVCLDEENAVWFMLHSGSRGVGNAIGSHFIEMAQKDMRTHIANLPDKDLAYLEEGTQHYDDYVQAVGWAQKFARMNREVMMQNLIAAVRTVRGSRELPPQLCAKGASLRQGCPGDAQGGGVGARRRARDHPRFDGGQELHRARQGQPGELQQLQPRRRPHHEPQ